MAGARDIARARKLQLQEQARRNKEARDAREARLQAREDGMRRPSDQRLHTRFGSARKPEAEPNENKMGPDSGMENKGNQDDTQTDMEKKLEENGLKGVEFGSDEAAELAIESGLVTGDFEDWSPSGKSGFIKSDVEHIAKEKQNSQ